MGLKIGRKQEYFKSINKQIERVSKGAADTGNGLAAYALSRLLANSAQFSGNFAANWNYSVNSPDTSIVDVAFDDLFQPKIMGDGEAIGYALGKNRGRDTSYTLGDSFYLTNGADKGEGPYALLIENNEIKFRPGNEGMTIQRTIMELKPFERLTAQTMNMLANKKVGDV